MADPHTASPPGTRIAAEAKATLDRQRDGPDRPQQIGEPEVHTRPGTATFAVVQVDK